VEDRLLEGDSVTERSVVGLTWRQSAKSLRLVGLEYGPLRRVLRLSAASDIAFFLRLSGCLHATLPEALTKIGGREEEEE